MDAVGYPNKWRRSSTARSRGGDSAGDDSLSAGRGSGPLSLRLQIELVYDPGCPNVPRAREVLTRACREAGVPAVWTEWDSEASECPEHARNMGSPTILVNGEDVAPGPHPWAPRQAGQGPRLRVYREGDALVPAPPTDKVRQAIIRAVGPDVG